MSTSSDAYALGPGEQVDAFRVVGALGRGGMGEVYKAVDTTLEREVALKMASASDSRDPAYVSRFEREARSASALNHPNVAQIYSIGRYKGRPYYAMEYVKGRSLEDVLHEAGRVSGQRGLSFLLQACEGLRAAQESGVIHRDIKPANLMIDDKDRLKIVDFGLAKRHGDVRLTETDRVMGTPRYMSPEQATGKELDERSDIYSLGATFYHLFAGEPPFDADSAVAVMLKHVNDPLPKVREKNPRVPPGVASLVERMLAKRPEDRYPTYDELIEDIKKARVGTLEAPARSTVHITPAWPQATASAPASDSARNLLFGGILLAVIAGLAIVLFQVAGLKRELKKPATSAASAPASATSETTVAPASESAGTSEMPDRPVAGGRAPIAPLPMSGSVDPRQAIGMALKMKTMANMKRLSMGVQVYMAEREDAPYSLREIANVQDLNPRELVDGWGHEILYEHAGPRKYRLVSAGEDGSRDTADDIVLENGTFTKGEEEAVPAFLERR